MWRAICTEGLRSEVIESLHDVVVALEAMETAALSPTELCEHALLYAYLNAHEPSEHWEGRSLESLNHAVELMAAPPRVHKGLYGGLAGIGWMLQHTYSLLRGTVDDPADRDSLDDDSLAELDTYILDFLAHSLNLGRNFDLISGYVGIGMYWLERLPRRSAVAGLCETCHALKRLSTSMVRGITWFTPPSLVPPSQIDDAPSGYYNLGVAHGVPGVIGFLAQAARAGLPHDVTQEACDLLAGAVEWLLAQQRPPDAISRYSCWAIPGQDCGDSRLSWCYGDLGIAAVLQCVAQQTNNCNYSEESKRLMDRCTIRQVNAHVPDAPLCHGALGNAHMYNRAFQRSREVAYKEAALEWLRKGLAMRKAGTGIAGYYAWRPEEFPREAADVSFLSGAVGVALALLSTVSSVEPAWDRIMLLSSRC